MGGDEQQPSARLETFELRLRMDATLTINGQEQWLKPGTETGMRWKGYQWNDQWVDPLPTEDQISAAFQIMQQKILAPVLDEMIMISQRVITEARRSG
jgi:hypothetical protein